MLATLMMMGFEYDVALLALKSVHYINEDRAIAFLKDKGNNNKYEHPFIGINNALCKICMEDQEAHNI